MIATIKNNRDKIVKIADPSLYLFGPASNEKSIQKMVTVVFCIGLKKMNCRTISKNDYFEPMYNLEKITGRK